MRLPGKTDTEYQVTIPDHIRRDRADKVLATLFPELSRSRWQKLFEEGRVWCEDRLMSKKDKLVPGDVVDYSIPPVEPIELKPVPMDLSILFEDEDLLVLDKAAGVVVHPGAGTGGDTLVHGLLHHCRGSLSGIGGKERPGIVHRLDKETSGVLLVAKSERAFQSLVNQFFLRIVEKRYRALLQGVPEAPKGTITEPIGRHPVHRTRMTCRPDGRHAKTDYKVLRTWGTAGALADIYLDTGRTHQIRVHMKHIGNPLLGDPVYGFKMGRLVTALRGREIAIPRVLLHAWRIGFEHPVSGERMAFEAPLPADFRQVMEDLSQVIEPSESH